MKLLKCQNILFAALGTFFLIACGESITSETTISEYQGNLDVIADIAELPKCTSENEGEQFFVKSISAVRVCAGGDWYAVAGTASQVTSCSTEELADGTGIKILCGGDSIGVVLNGKDGSQGLQGERGDQGVQGEKGDKGDIGATGAQGLQGEKGDKGEVGATGAQGVQGEKGETGATGAAGTPGKDGATGAAGTPGKDGTSCTVVTLPDNAGLKVLCGGDSVGVVLNGEKGDKGDKGDKGEQGDKGDKGEQGDVGPAGSGAGSEGSSCNLVNKDCIVHVACGGDTVSLEVYSSDESCKESVELDSEAIALNLEGFSGSSQKGPFLTGSEVIAYELLDGRSLQQTGKTFQGKILSDKGDFNIRTVSLASQYATLTAKGYYLNEVTGLPSKSQITLTALTNLRGRAVANINLLTHLENERAQYLVIMDKMTVAAAKKKAEAEVFSLFHIDSRNFAGYSEDLTIGGNSDADAALLAISIILQSNLSEGELLELITKISSQIETTGTWDDEKKVNLAKWASDADLNGYLPKYRSNVERWKLSARVADFEPYIRNFWYTEFGLPKCGGDEGVAHGTLAAASADFAKTSSDRYVCVDSLDAEGNKVGFVWRWATTFEKDTYGILCKDGFASVDGVDYASGSLFTGLFSSQKYVCDGNEIRTASSFESYVDRACVEEGLTIVFDKTNNSLVCKSGNWTWNGLAEAGVLVDERDGTVYSTTKINDRVWMAENLNYYDESKYGVMSNRNWCYDNVADNCRLYGRLYSWSAAMDSAGVFSDDAKYCGNSVTCVIQSNPRGICPEGWHIPSATEWKSLYNGVSYEKLQSKLAENWSDATDALGFAAYPAGYRNSVNGFVSMGSLTNIWSSSPTSYGANTFSEYLRFESDGPYMRAYGKGTEIVTKNDGFYVRCVKDY